MVYIILGHNDFLVLEKRLERAWELIEKDKTQQKIILSGGVLCQGEKKEFECMFIFFQNKGIEKERLIIEDKSTNTYENLFNCSDLLNDDDEVIIITSMFHARRTYFLALILFQLLKRATKRSHLVSFPFLLGN